MAPQSLETSKLFPYNNIGVSVDAPAQGRSQLKSEAVTILCGSLASIRTVVGELPHRLGSGFDAKREGKPAPSFPSRLP